jgi:hypothetical protein
MREERDQLAAATLQGFSVLRPRWNRASLRSRLRLESRLVRVLLLLPLVFTLLDFFALQHMPIPDAHDSTLAFDRWLTGGVVPTVWLQAHFLHVHALRWYDWAGVVTYASHFVVWPVLAITLWVRDYPAFRRFVAVFVPLTVAGYATYVIWPVNPPWLAADAGALPHVDRLTLVALTTLGVPATIIHEFDGSSISAAVAGAVPSLHAAYPMLLLLCYWRSAGTFLRVALAAYVPLMALTLVYAGEHYVGDILLGWLYAIVAYVLVEAVRRRRRNTRGLPADG